MTKLWGSMMKNFLCNVLFLALLITNTGAFGESAILLKVAGNFKVKTIEKEEGGFKVIFAPEDGGKDLLLKTTHIHSGISLGSSVRLSAEVINQSFFLEVNQVVLYLPIPEGFKPVWMLSQKFRDGSTPGRYIEMHDPQSDYLFF